MAEKALALRLADELDGIPLADMTEALADDAAAELRRLHAENKRLRGYELANNLWHEKTDWVQETVRPLELGRHRADVLKQRIERLHVVNAELLEALEGAAEAFEILANGGGVDTYWYARLTSDAIAKAEGKV